MVTSLFAKFEQLNPDWITLSIHIHRRHFLKAQLPCASIQLTQNFLFTEAKLKLHGFHQVLLQHKRHSRAVVHRCSSSRSQMFYETGVLKKFAIFARKQLCWSLFLVNIVTKRFQHRCFPVHIAKF